MIRRVGNVLINYFYFERGFKLRFLDSKLLEVQKTFTIQQQLKEFINSCITTIFS